MYAPFFFFFQSLLQAWTGLEGSRMLKFPNFIIFGA